MPTTILCFTNLWLFTNKTANCWVFAEKHTKMEEFMIAIGIDIGGTSIKGAAVTSEGKVLEVYSMPVEKGEPQETTINKLIDITNKYLNEHGYNKDSVKGIGIGVPGAIDSKHGVCSASNNLGWSELPIQKMMEEGTGLPVRITNDANAAALGEARYGAGKEFQNIIMITLGTGVGGGIVIDGKLYEGNEGKGAELGHTLLVLGGHKCTCGRNGCFEQYASATALIRDTKVAMDKNPDSMMWDLFNKYGKVDGRVAFDAAKAGDKIANEVVDQYVYFLSEGLLNYCNIFRPEAIILSGGIANAGDFLIDKIKLYLKDHIYGFPATPAVDVKVSELGYDSGKIGAAALFF